MGIKPTTPELRRAVEANLFPAALPAIGEWNAFDWHGPSTAREHSSQALAIDVFGTIAQAPSKDVVLNALAEHLGLPAGGEWEVHLEWQDTTLNLLKERSHTEVDVMLSSPQVVIYSECKFTESGSPCSPAKPSKKIASCNGHYALQTNPRDGSTNICALTTRGIRYWEVIPTVFDYANDVEHHPCPFAGEWFQWMRNAVGAAESARHAGKRAGFLLAYADAPNLHIARHIQSGDWQNFVQHVRPGSMSIGALSYQALLQLAINVAPTDSVWPELEAWVVSKITNVSQSRSKR